MSLESISAPLRRAERQLSRYTRSQPSRVACTECPLLTREAFLMVSVPSASQRPRFDDCSMLKLRGRLVPCWHARRWDNSSGSVRTLKPKEQLVAPLSQAVFQQIFARCRAAVVVSDVSRCSCPNPLNVVTCPSSMTIFLSRGRYLVGIIEHLG